MLKGCSHFHQIPNSDHFGTPELRFISAELTDLTNARLIS